MGSFFDIVRRNNSTFYDNRSGKALRIWPRLVVFFGLAAGLTWLIGTPSDAVVSSVITVQSILVGFGFSVLFFLVSAEQEREVGSESLESKNRKKRLNKLSDELFFNISYYNMVTIISVLLALVFAFNISNVRSDLASLSQSVQIADDIIRSLNFVVRSLYLCMIFLLYFAFIESVFTFCRIVLRVNFYFDQKRRISAEGRDQE